MSEMQTFEQVKAMILENFTVDESKVTPTMTFEDLGADSLDMVEFVMGIEESFDIEFDDERIEDLTNIQDAVDYIDQLRSEK